MGLKKSQKLRTIFIKYIVTVGIFVMVLLIVNYYLFFRTSFGAYPANYSERVIENNLNELKNSSKVTMDLLTPMCSFGVYSNNGDYLYGNFSNNEKKAIWDKYRKGVTYVGLSSHIMNVHREEGILLIKYPLSMQYKNERLRNILPNAEITMTFMFFAELILIIILLSNKFARKVNRELESLLKATKKIEEQDLNFDVDVSNIEEINMILQGIDKMKGSLKSALERQWTAEQQKKEQISALVHDVKTPLTVVKGNVGLLGETDMTEEQKTYCRYIEESSNQMEIYIQNLFSIIKEESNLDATKETVYIMEMLNSLKEQGDALAKTKNIELIWKTDIEKSAYIKGYKDELERALMNIIANAVDFSPADSTITVESAADNFQFIIRITDQGKGFSQKMLKHGQEQFSMESESRTKNGHHGLGLYVADTIIKKHNGKLILSNNIKGGGLVTVEIPMSAKVK